MCFSATASFVAGGALGAAGALTLNKVRARRELPFASIPLLFGAQQVIEGVVWLSFGSPLLNSVATSAYSLFAFILWPVFIPYAVRSLETVSWRRRVLAVFQLIGIAVGAYLLIAHLQLPITSQVINKNIVYSTRYAHSSWILAFYIVATTFSALFSSHRIVNIFGVLVLASAGAAYWFFAVAFVSVWCFFAALLSGIIFWFFIAKTKRRA